MTNIDEAAGEMQQAVSYLQDEFNKLQIGRASSNLVEGIEVEAYGSKQSLKTMAGISTPDQRTIQIQSWDRSVLGAIEKAIRDADLGLNPVNDGVVVRVNLPQPTEERRTELVKIVKQLVEEARISVRQIRQKALDEIKRSEKDKEISEDDSNRFQKQLQNKVDEFNKKMEELAGAKEKDIMTV